ncbi:hypothetical protein D3C86_1815630 [compost metagenome]
MARHRRAPPVPHELGARIEMRGDGLQAQRLDAARRELDRQGDAVQLAAQLRGQQRIAVFQIEA